MRALTVLLVASGWCMADVRLSLGDARDGVTQSRINFVSADKAAPPGEPNAEIEPCEAIPQFASDALAKAPIPHRLGSYSVRVLPPDDSTDLKQRFYVEAPDWRKCFRIALRGPWRTPARDMIVDATLIITDGRARQESPIKLLVRGEAPPLEIALSCKTPYPVRAASEPESCAASFFSHSVQLQLAQPFSNNKDVQVVIEPSRPRSNPRGPVLVDFRASSSIQAIWPNLLLRPTEEPSIVINVPYEVDQVGLQSPLQIPIQVRFEAPWWLLCIAVATGCLLASFVRYMANSQRLSRAGGPGGGVLALTALVIFTELAWLLTFVTKAKVGFFGYDLEAGLLPGALLEGAVAGLLGLPAVLLVIEKLRKWVDKLNA